MSIQVKLAVYKKAFLDSAPVIYFVEENPQYIAVVNEIFDFIDDGELQIVTSPITLAECLVFPISSANTRLIQSFQDLILNGFNTNFVSIDESIAHLAAKMRASYNLHLPDALQVAVAITSGCDVFLTNDKVLAKVSEISVIVLDDLL